MGTFTKSIKKISREFKSSLNEIANDSELKNVKESLTEIKEIKEGLVVRTNKFKIYAKKGYHSRTNFAFTLKENNRPGIFYPKKAKKLCIPEGKKWSALQKGKQIRFNNSFDRVTNYWFAMKRYNIFI